ncbi:DNA-directed RNA polymerase subunit sigma [Acetobacter estunensis NRIC 0472]|uniref:Sigma-70 family RNA polymerase sigma factor n=1 Tax=Acetobacter estunensis TaxID=104097 RepID=A0A967EJL5_9PROT|nr:sigma-70 family RNA polymerase sigma factor [Acetobacter estunensis]NHO55419.1 sigma-70 family RNA polymerase sigma factor [Acetobacter estunensis]GBQ25721.1 DNA-directed RNA polymerase subunit sigma [Acetobacter estunensis NRIC 0472]
MEDGELRPKHDPDVVRAAEEDDDDQIELLYDGDEVDIDELARVIRPDFVAKAFKALSADAQRGGGSLARADVNRTYLRRKLSIAECVELEVLLATAGHKIVEVEEESPVQNSANTSSCTKRIRYLSETEERELGRRIQLALHLPELTDGLDQAYVDRVRADAEKARATFVTANLRYVEMVARRRGQKQHMALEDLVQEGVIGLMRATDLYDPDRGFRFKTYATWWIEQRIQRAIADSDRLVRLPVHLHEKMARIRRAEARLTLANGRAPTSEELATAIGMDSERLMKLLWRVQATDCIEGDTPIGEDTTLLALAADPRDSAFDMVSYRELQGRFSDILMTLTPREERIMRMRFGIGIDRDHTLESIGQDYSVTRERIRQIEAKALGKLRHFVRSSRLRGFLDS